MDHTATAGIVKIGRGGQTLWASEEPGRQGRRLYHRVEFLLPTEKPGEFQLRAGPQPIGLIVDKSGARPQNPTALGSHVRWSAADATLTIGTKWIHRPGMRLPVVPGESDQSRILRAEFLATVPRGESVVTGEVRASSAWSEFVQPIEIDPTENQRITGWLVAPNTIRPLSQPLVVKAEVLRRDGTVDLIGAHSHWAVRPAAVDFVENPAWVKVPSEWRDAQTAALDLSRQRPGRYEVALVLERLPPFAGLTHPIRVVGQIAIADDQRPLHVSVFTDRNRQVFCAGEDIPLTVSVGVDGGGATTLPAEVELHLELHHRSDGRRLRQPGASEGGHSLGKLRFAPRPFRGRRVSFRRVIQSQWSLGLAAGDYLVQVKSNVPAQSAVGHSLPVRLIDRQARSGIPSVMFLTGSNDWRGGGHTLSGGSTRAGLRGAAENMRTLMEGYHADVVLTWGSEISLQHPGDWLRSVSHPESTSLGAAERLSVPDSQNPLALAALSQGSAFMTMPFQIDNPFFPVAIPRDINELHWTFTSVGNRHRWLPNFIGYIDSCYWRPTPVTGSASVSANKPPDGAVHTREQELIWQDFCRRTGYVGQKPTDWNLVFTLPGGKNCRPGSPIWEAWSDYICRLYARAQKRLRRVTGRGVPGVLHTDFRSEPMLSTRWSIYGPNSGLYSSFQDPERSFDGLDVISATGWQKHGDNLCFEPLFWGDLFGHPAKRVNAAIWTPGFGAGTTRYTEVLKHVGMNLARGTVPAYLGLNTYGILPFTNTGHRWNRVDYGFREELKLAFDFVQCFGELATRAERRGPVAVLASWHQGVNESGRSFRNGADLWELIGGLYMANSPATFVYESDVEADALTNFKVLFITGQTVPLPKPVSQKLAAFVKAGGVIIANRNSTAALPDTTKRVDLGLGAWWQFSRRRDRMVRELTPPRTFNADDMQQIECYKIALSHRDKLRRLLSEHTQHPPFADCDVPFVFCSTLQSGTGRLVFVVNDTSTGNPLPVGVPRQTTAWNRPVKTMIRFGTSTGHLYDLWRQREILERDRNNRLTDRADLTRHAFRAYYHVPKRPQRPQIVMSPQATLGSHLTVEVQWLDAAGEPVTFPVPTELTLLGCNRRGEDSSRIAQPTSSEHRAPVKVLRRVVPAEGRTVVFKVPLNSRPGNWTLRVNSLLDGRTFHQAVAVKQAVDKQRRSPLRVGADVVVHEQRRVREFLAAGGFSVAVAPGQPLSSEIRALADSLGAPVKTVKEVARDFHGWLVYRKDLRSYVWPHARCEEPLLLVGQRTGNPLIEQLLATGSTLADFGPNSPGPGNGLIQWVPNAFDGGYDVVLALAADERGLAALQRRLQALQRRAAADSKDSVHRTRQTFVPQDVRAMRTRDDGARADWFANGLPANGPAKTSVLGRDASIRRFTQRRGVCTFALSATSDGRGFVVAADSWDRNVFVFADDQVVRSIHTDTPFVQQVGISPGGSVVAAEPMNAGVVTSYSHENRSLWTLPVARSLSTDYLALSTDRKLVFAVDRQLVLRAREIATGVDRWAIQLPDEDSDRFLRSIASLTTSGDGNALVVGVHTRFVGATNDLTAGQIAEIRRGVAARIVRVDTDTGRIKWTRAVPFRGRIIGNRSIHPTSDGLSTALNHTGSRLAMCDARGNLRVWDKDGQLLHRFPQRLYTDPGPLELELSRDGRFLLGYPRTGESVNRLFLFDLDEQKTWTFDPLEQISDATFNRDGTRLIWAAWDGDVRAQDLVQQRQLWRTRVGSGARLLSLADGQTVAATYFGDVIGIGIDGTARWSRNLSPLCYPQQTYEPAFRPDR
ncbi:MAG TPA: hypothetical protein DCE39_01920 [Planctomycetaceae bacterium]|nr:hypothetical protein [Planctomycetaceae bacterium]